jgi:transcriptional regulator with XRE-family HTH domain
MGRLVMTDERPELESAEIGARARRIRKRRGLSLATVAGLAGISKSYLSELENGHKRFERRSLLGRLAEALGCSVVDLTGEPYGPADRLSGQAMTTIPDIRLALHDCAFDDVPDAPSRPVPRLADAMHGRMAQYLDQCRYDRAGDGLGQLLTELQITVATGSSDERRRALPLLVEGAIVAFGVTKNLGYPDLALTAATTAAQAAQLTENPALAAWASQRRAQALQRVGAHRRAERVLTGALTEVEAFADPTAQSTEAAEAYGLLHLTAAMNAARLGDSSDAHAHLDHAAELAARTGERNGLGQHFGPSNVAVWRVSIGVELGEGAAVEDQVAAPIDFEALGSADRVAMFHVDMARALSQEGGPRDWDATRHLDRADRVAPLRIRFDPVARELLAELRNRAKSRTWELDSLHHRFGLN